MLATIDLSTGATAWWPGAARAASAARCDHLRRQAGDRGDHPRKSAMPLVASPAAPAARCTTAASRAARRRRQLRLLGRSPRPLLPRADRGRGRAASPRRLPAAASLVGARHDGLGRFSPQPISSRSPPTATARREVRYGLRGYNVWLGSRARRKRRRATASRASRRRWLSTALARTDARRTTRAPARTPRWRRARPPLVVAVFGRPACVTDLVAIAEPKHAGLCRRSWRARRGISTALACGDGVSATARRARLGKLDAPSAAARAAAGGAEANDRRDGAQPSWGRSARRAPLVEALARRGRAL